MKKLGILLTHHHRLLSVASMLDVFETLNQLYVQDGKDRFFDIRLVYPKEPSMAYEDHAQVSISDKDQYDILLIPAFKPQGLAQLSDNGVCIPWLQKQYQHGSAIASFCTGAFLLAITGLLNGKSATTHINAEQSFAAAFPQVKLQAEAVVTEEDRIYTSGGATNSFHLMMRLIENYCSRAYTVRIAKIFSIDLDRTQQTYFGTFTPSENHGDDLVKKVQEEIKKHFKESTTIEELITEVPSSRRNLVRRFKHATGLTPIEYLQKTRIEAAKQLLEHSKHSIMEVMLESGYNDLKTFRLLFKKTVGITPTGYREKFNPSLITEHKNMQYSNS